MSGKPFRLFYARVMPILTIILLMIVPGLIQRDLLINQVFDFMARLWFCSTLCLGYWELSDIDNLENISPFSLKTNIVSIDQGGILDIISMVFVLVMSIILTRLLIWAFLPIFTDFEWGLAFVNGLIVSLPFFARIIKFRIQVK
jgi:hypothetical protein